MNNTNYKTHTRMSFSVEHININGINIKYGPEEIEHVIKTIKNLGVGACSINEHTLNVLNVTVISKVHDVLSKVDKYGKISMFADTKSENKSWWKPGGSMVGLSGR